jgi:hypothetical protein
MNIRAGGRWGLVLVTGLVVCFAAPQQVTAAGSDSAAAASKADSATSGKSVRQSSRHWKRYAHRKYHKVASKSDETKKAAEKDVADATPDTPSGLPATVANANAQMTSADASGDSASAMTAKANTMLLAAAADKPAEAQAPPDAAVVASDQLNDVDRALQQTPSPPTVAMASAKPDQAAPAQASSSDSSSWDETSLIGKIFIGFGALLTMASAARMFMA